MQSGSWDSKLTCNLSGSEGIRHIAGFGLRTHEVMAEQALVVPLHTHEPGRITIVLQGVLVETFGQHEADHRECPAGTVILRAPGATHALRVERAPLHLIVIDVDGERAADLWPPPGEAAFLRAEQIGAHIPRRLLAELHFPDRVSATAIDALVCSMIVAASRASSPAAMRPDWLERAIRLIERHGVEPLSLRDVAAAVGVAAERLAHRFKSDLGCTVGDYIRTVRVGCAAQLLAETDRSIGEIAMQAGFYDQSHFSKTFKDYTGMTPATFRRSHRSSPLTVRPSESFRVFTRRPDNLVQTPQELS
jgi:AraC family transcriptional regulator